MSNSNLPRKIIYGSGGYVTDIRKNLATFRRFMIRRSVPIQRTELVNKLKIVKPRFIPSDDASLKQLKSTLKTGVMELFDGHSNVTKIGMADLIKLADKIVRVLENVSPALLHKTLEPLIQVEEHGLKRSQVSKARPRIIKEKSNTTKRPRINKAKSNKAKRPLTDYMKFAAAQRKTDAIKALPPKDRMAAIGKLWSARSESASEGYDGDSDSDMELTSGDESTPAQPARMRNKGKKGATKSKSASKSKGGPKKKTSTPSEPSRVSRRAKKPIKRLVDGRGMQMEGGRWQDYIPPEVKSMAMKQARKFAGKVIASDDLFGSGMYRD